MTNHFKIFTFFALIACMLISCNKTNNQISDLQIVRNNNNKISYPATKLDSVQAISAITKQKIQELLDLSTLYTSGNRDTEIDSVIYAQMQSYFVDQDSNKLATLLSELDSLKVQSAKVGELEVSKQITPADTLDFAKFYVEYFDQRNRSIGNFNKNVQYILKATPVKFKKEFKFYFVNFDVRPEKDSTSVGVTK